MEPKRTMQIVSPAGTSRSSEAREDARRAPVVARVVDEDVDVCRSRHVSPPHKTLDSESRECSRTTRRGKARRTLLPLLELLSELGNALERGEVGDERDALALVALLVELVGRLLERLLVARRDVDAGGAALEVAVGDLQTGTSQFTGALLRDRPDGRVDALPSRRPCRRP